MHVLKTKLAHTSKEQQQVVMEFHPHSLCLSQLRHRPLPTEDQSIKKPISLDLNPDSTVQAQTPKQFRLSGHP